TPVTSRPVSLAISAATLAVRSGCWSLRTTVAPSRAKVLATASPMPAPAAAVTKTTLSENSIITPVVPAGQAAQRGYRSLVGSGDQLPHAQRAVCCFRAELPGPAGRGAVGG